jgi:pilus assembly protein Flp/PilA
MRLLAMMRLQRESAPARRSLYCLLNDQSGVTAIEYALIAGGIGIAIATIVVNVGSALESVFVSVESGFN